MNLFNKIKSHFYLKKLKAGKIEISEIKEKYLTNEICMYELKKHINYFRIMPKRLINQDISTYVFNKCIEYFEYIPDEYKTKNMCIKVFNIDFNNIKYIPKSLRDEEMYYNTINNINNFMDLISLEEVNDKLKRLYIDKAIRNKPDYILKLDDINILEYNWIDAIKSQEKLVFELPAKYKNNNFFKKIIEIKPSFISKMPLDQLSQDLFDLSFKKDPNLVKYFPDQYITKEMSEYIRHYLPQYKKRIPLRYQ